MDGPGAWQWIDLPPLWLAGFAGLAWGAGQLWPVPAAWLAVSAPLGLGLVAAGLALVAAAAWQFRRARTTILPHRVPAALVTGGVYRLSRNPIYLGDALILAGLGLVWGAHAALAVLLPAFVLVIHRRFVRPEEARLRAAFGPAFDAFAARTRAWI